MSKYTFSVHFVTQLLYNIQDKKTGECTSFVFVCSQSGSARSNTGKKKEASDTTASKKKRPARKSNKCACPFRITVKIERTELVSEREYEEEDGMQEGKEDSGGTEVEQVLHLGGEIETGEAEDRRRDEGTEVEQELSRYVDVTGELQTREAEDRGRDDDSDEEQESSRGGELHTMAPGGHTVEEKGVTEHQFQIEYSVKSAKLNHNHGMYTSDYVESRYIQH